MTHLTSHKFKLQSKKALSNVSLQKALGNLKTGFVHKRAIAIAELNEFDAIRQKAVEIKNHTLEHLDFYLEQFEREVIAKGGVVHWAVDAKEACDITLAIAKSVDAKRITKGKSMVTEEIELNKALEAQGISVVETDLGEYIIQLRQETPSHIVAPAIHVLKEQIATSFYDTHQTLPKDRKLDEPAQLLAEARDILRQQFLTADVGMTGANFVIAENGATAIVTNEGNGDLTQTCAKVHIVITGIEKVMPTMNDAMNVLRLLSRSATGQAITSYVTFSMGPKRPTDLDGPEQFHVILVDNGRSKMLGTPVQDMLRCIRCGACLNHCPVYDAIGGQAYGSVYPGPMGAVLSPGLFGLKEARDLPNASTFCGRCEEVCPMKIPLPSMMRHYREEEYKQHLSSFTGRQGLKAWAFLAKHPRLYHFFIGLVSYFLRCMGQKKGSLHRLLLAKGWTKYRDFPVPSNKTFHQLWRERKS